MSFIAYCNCFLYLLNSLIIFITVFSAQWPITESNNYSVLLVLDDRCFDLSKFQVSDDKRHVVLSTGRMLCDSLRGRRKKGRGRGEGEREKGRERLL